MNIRLVCVAVGFATTAWACAEFEPTRELVIPTDERPVQRSDEMPPPIQGGTLTVLRDGQTAIAADPARDRVSIVNVPEARLVTHIRLRDGDEPGRVVEGADGRVHVALRGADAVATLDVETRGVVARRDACRGPRGMAWDPEATALHVACVTGRLVTFRGEPIATSGRVVLEDTPSRQLTIAPDLRDVIVADGTLLVSRFKSAELLEVSAEGSIVTRRTPPATEHDEVTADGSTRTVRMTPSVGWRLTQGPDGDPYLVHQRGQRQAVRLQEPTPEQPSSYGGGGPASGACQSIVHSAVTRMARSRGETISTGALPGSVLPVDLAVADTGRVAVANAGTVDPDQPRPSVERRGSDAPPSVEFGASPRRESTGVSVASARKLSGRDDSCSFQFRPSEVTEPVVAVAFTPGESPTLIAQQRQPARLLLLEDDFHSASAEVALGGKSVAHTGHELFHRNTGAGIACASCHPGGREDGRVWRFEDLGPRRTQPLNVGLEGTAPFHWDGTLGDIDALMEEVMVGRMGGVHQSDARSAALADWLFALDRPEPRVHPDAPAAQRGRNVFEQAECGRCHTGESLTNNGNYDVGTGGQFQVPSLVGIGLRAPFLHDGCADTLRERFDPECGGEAHGETDELGAEQIDDLVTYLHTL